MIQGVNHIAMSVPDLGKAISFYCDLLGFKKVEQASWKADSATAEAVARLTGRQVPRPTPRICAAPTC